MNRWKLLVTVADYVLLHKLPERCLGKTGGRSSAALGNLYIGVEIPVDRSVRQGSVGLAEVAAIELPRAVGADASVASMLGEADRL